MLMKQHFIQIIKQVMKKIKRDLCHIKRVKLKVVCMKFMQLMNGCILFIFYLNISKFSKFDCKYFYLSSEV